MCVMGILMALLERTRSVSGSFFGRGLLSVVTGRNPTLCTESWSGDRCCNGGRLFVSCILSPLFQESGCY